MEASITFKSVAKKNKDETLLAELTFGVEKNTRFALVGPNGSGKSTILKLICGFIHKDKGSIYIKGFDADINSKQIKSITIAAFLACTWENVLIEINNINKNFIKRYFFTNISITYTFRSLQT